MSKPRKFHINWLGSAGSALGAVTSAVLLSTLGAGGTLFGAALGSLVITVGGTIYTQSLEKTKKLVVPVRGSGEPIPSSDVESRAVVSQDPLIEEELVLTEELAADPDPASEKASGLNLRGLPWKRILGLTVGLFVVAVAIILMFELSTGRPVSSFTGGTSATDTGTTFSELRSGGGDSGDPDAEEPDAQATTTEQPTEQQTTEQEPTTEDATTEAPRERREDPPPADAPPADAPPADAPPADQPPADQSGGSDE